MEEEEANTLGHFEGCGCETSHVWKGREGVRIAGGSVDSGSIGGRITR